MIVMNGEERLEREVQVEGIRLEHVSEFKYMGCVLDESGTDGAEYSKEVASGKRVVGTIRSLFNAKDLQLKCARVLHETLLIPVLTYDNETMLWKEKERPVQMDNLRVWFSIRRMDRVPNLRIRELCGVTKGVDKRIDDVLRWLVHVERVEKDRIAKRV